LPPAAAWEIDKECAEADRFIVCSHSCDLQRMQGERLFIARGRCVQISDGNFVGAKSINTLQLHTASGEIVHYGIESLQRVDVGILDRHAPWSDEAHSATDRVVLGAWLAQRFDRLALPDEVVNALEASGIRRVIEEKLKRAVGVLDVRIVLDENVVPPTTAFLLVYDSGIQGAEEAAKGTCEAIRKCAAKEHQALDGRVVFESATSVADSALRYALFRMTRPWRVEHISLRTTPPGQRPVR
jgi:hypothetical protein